MKYVFIALLFFSLSLSLTAQVLQERLYKTHTETSIIQAGDLTREGNVIYAGIRFLAIGRYEANLLLVKPNADTLWIRKGSEMSRFECDVKQTPKGGFIFAGSLRPPNYNSVNNSDMLLQSLNQKGTVKWSKPYIKTNDSEIPRALALMPDSGYVLGMVSDNKRFTLTRTDSLGNINWQKDYTWTTSGIESLADLKLTPNGDIIVAGITDYPIGPRHIKVMLFNANGDSLKGKQLVALGFGRNEVMYSDASTITPLSDGGFLLTGRVDTTVIGNPTAAMGMVIKLDSNLNIVWKYVHRTNPIQEHLFSEVKELVDGSIIVLAFRINPGNNGFGIFRFSGPNLNTITLYPFISSMCNTVNANILTGLNDSTYLVAGDCRNSGSFSMYVAKIKANGLPNSINSIKTIPTVTKTHLGQSYPNPAHDQTIIPYNLPNGTRSAKILLSDITGKEVGSYSLKLNQKQGSLSVNLNGFRNGLYLYNLVIDGKPVATKKLAVVR